MELRDHGDVGSGRMRPGQQCGPLTCCELINPRLSPGTTQLTLGAFSERAAVSAEMGMLSRMLGMDFVAVVG